MTLIVTAFAVETLSVTWCLKIQGAAPFFSFPYFVSGLGIAVGLLFFPSLRLPARVDRPWKSPYIHHRIILTGLVALALYSWSLYWFEELPIDVNTADMLPIIKVMGDRFIAGQQSHIYDTIPWIWGGAQPIYLPAMWLPYTPAIAVGIDMRWVNMACLLFVAGAFLFLYRPRDDGYRSFFLGVIAFLLFWWVVADNTPGIVSTAEEGVVIGYYVLLVLALVSGRPWLTGIAVSLCMLSRYALVGWIPAYIFYLVLEKRWKTLWIIAATGIACFVGLFLLPVGWVTFLRLFRLPGDYIAFAARVWKDSPDVFSTAPAFAWFFGPGRVALQHGLLVVLSFVLPILFIGFCRRLRSHRKLANIPLAALKLSLVVFYSFIDVPYLYLFYTSSFVSLILLTLALRTSQEDAGTRAASDASQSVRSRAGQPALP
ncbi:MAG: hypothetical protein P4L51_25185 [Puia sp.]|nr:hypothetical protein [Puia sp.]